jgi:chemotaxis protein MotB
MDHFQNKPQTADEIIALENGNEQLRKENSALYRELLRLKKISDNYNVMTDQVKWHKSQLVQAKTSIGKYKLLVLKTLQKKDLLLKKYEKILYGANLPERGKAPGATVVDTLKVEIQDLAKENTLLNREKEFLKKETEELESNMLLLEEKEINDTKDFRQNSEARATVSAEFTNGLESFLVTYSDLITLILVIFVLLYSISKVDGGKFTEVFSSFQEDDIVLKHTNVRLDTKEFEMLNRVRELVKDNVDPESLIRSDVRTILIRLKSSDLFSPGSSELLEGAEQLILDSIRDDITDGVKQIHVDGHTDNVPMKDNGLFPTNWELSSVRASHVARVIIKKANFSPKRMVVTGYGEYRPLKPNSSDDNRALNRRVEIKILKDLKVEDTGKEIQLPKFQ